MGDQSDTRGVTTQKYPPEAKNFGDFLHQTPLQMHVLWCEKTHKRMEKVQNFRLRRWYKTVVPQVYILVAKKYGYLDFTPPAGGENF